MDVRHVGLGFWLRSAERERTASQRTRRNRSVVSVEFLEGRELLTSAIGNVTTLPASVVAGPMVTSLDGNLWVAESNGTAPQIARITASGGTTQYNLPAWEASGTVNGLAADKAGNVWYSIAIPTTGVTGGVSGRIGEITPNGKMSEFQLPYSDDVPGQMALGPDGNLWVGVSNPTLGYAIEKVTPTGAVTRIAINGTSVPRWLAAGSDGGVWFVQGNQIDRLNPSDGTLKTFAMPTPTDGSAVDLSNAQLTLAGDGNLWFIGLGGLSQITPTGQVTTLPAPGASITSLSTASDGNLWISFLPPTTGPLSGTLGAIVARITTTGVTTIVPDRAAATSIPVWQMVGGPDASLWLDEAGSTIGRLNITSIPSFTAPIVMPTTAGSVTTDANGNFSGTIASFNSNLDNTTAASFIASINWGDGHITTGSIVANANGGYDVDGNNDFSVPTGTTEKATISITGPNSAQAVIYGVVNVTNTSWQSFPAGTSTPITGGTSSGTSTPTSGTTGTTTPLTGGTSAGSTGTGSSTTGTTTPLTGGTSTGSTGTGSSTPGSSTNTSTPTTPTQSSTPAGTTSPVATPTVVPLKLTRAQKLEAALEAARAKRAAIVAKGHVVASGKTVGATHPKGPAHPAKKVVVKKPVRRSY